MSRNMVFFSEAVLPRLMSPQCVVVRQGRSRGGWEVTGKDGCCRGWRPVQSLLSDLILFGIDHKLYWACMTELHVCSRKPPPVVAWRGEIRTKKTRQLCNNPSGRQRLQNGESKTPSRISQRERMIRRVRGRTLRHRPWRQKKVF